MCENDLENDWGGQCRREANVGEVNVVWRPMSFFKREANVGEVNVGEANVIAPNLKTELLAVSI